MDYTDAFRKMGASLNNILQDWSAVADDGMPVITLWANRFGKPDGGVVKVTVDSENRERWMDKPGNKLRKRHIQLALEKFDGEFKVIVVTPKDPDALDLERERVQIPVLIGSEKLSSLIL